MSTLTPAQQLMVDDGAPVEIVGLTQEQRAEAWKSRRPIEDPATTAAGRKQTTNPAAEAASQESPMETHTTSKASQVKALREKRAATKGPKAKKATPKKAAKKAKAAAKPKTPRKAKKAATSASANGGGVRPGSKLELIVGLLTRPEGCTTADVLKATDWPAVSMPQQAKAAGLKLSKEKDGKVTRYHGTAA